jgi:formylglycine-generating enzyme required for sulfatase activity
MPTIQKQIEALHKKIAAYRALQEQGEDFIERIEALEAELRPLVETQGGAPALTERSGWNNNSRSARCAYRNRNIPDNFNNNIGFRCVVSIAVFAYPVGSGFRVPCG